MFSFTDEAYRREQEEFVSNHGGSTAREVILAILPNVCSLIFSSSTIALFGNQLSRNLKTLLEFILIVVNCVLSCTIFADHSISLSLGMLLISFGNFYFIVSKKNSAKWLVRTAPGRRPFVTNFRALTNLITAVCILAVDFHVFPRKFAKTEVYGFSLMDTGVGLFVLANALVSPEARDVQEPAWNVREHPKHSFFRRMTKSSRACVRNSAPLLILGLGRFIAVELSSYQTHVTEYGIHWNFFITLAFIKMLTSTMSTFVGSKYSLVSGIFIIGMHEYALNSGLKYWVLGSSPRDNFVSANREGISSVPGYVGLYLVGIAIGRLIHSTYNNERTRIKEKTKIFKKIVKDYEIKETTKGNAKDFKEKLSTSVKDFERNENVSDGPANYEKNATNLKRENIKNIVSLSETCVVNIPLFGHSIEFEYNNSMVLCVKLSLIAVQACAIMLYCSLNYQTSRRLANAGYCFWVVTLACALLTLLLLIEIKTDILVSSMDQDDQDRKISKDGPKDEENNRTAKKKKKVGFEDLSDKVLKNVAAEQSIRVPELFEAINFNGLVFFLFANFLTGIINMSIKTLYVENHHSVFIIIGYIATCTIVAVILYRHKIQLKL